MEGRFVEIICKVTDCRWHSKENICLRDKINIEYTECEDQYMAYCSQYEWKQFEKIDPKKEIFYSGVSG